MTPLMHLLIAYTILAAILVVLTWFVPRSFHDARLAQACAAVLWTISTFAWIIVLIAWMAVGLNKVM